MSEEEIRTLHKHFKQLVELAKTEQTLTRSHSIEEAEGRHKKKRIPEKK